MIPLNEPLRSSVRWGSALHTRSSEARDLMLLLAFGACTVALSALVKGNFGLPGHHILLVMPPLALGLARAPRRNGGLVMSTGALVSMTLLAAFGRPLGFGATTSSLLAGPLLDLFCTRRAKLRSPFLAILAAALITNSGAFLIRMLRKMSAVDSKALNVWLPKALVTYPGFAIIAALSALVLFRWEVSVEDEAGKCG
ncbi:MAG: hypothetical protein P1V97_01155 [Planctomycetota bacterium]|nr:hypothetical protein [Planctomycetota bacterium]